jgi:hypothetical protein
LMMLVDFDSSDYVELRLSFTCSAYRLGENREVAEIYSRE